MEKYTKEEILKIIEEAGDKFSKGHSFENVIINIPRELWDEHWPDLVIKTIIVALKGDKDIFLRMLLFLLKKKVELFYDKVVAGEISKDEFVSIVNECICEFTLPLFEKVNFGSE